jgi:ubiquinone/menaquinone biosynthesis C-methylase UbiE
MQNLYDSRFETVSAWKSDGYYDKAESYLSPFWDSGTPFRFLFDKLDTTDIVELACGHGRHVSIYQSLASTITLVDPNEENIIFCQRRFAKRGFAEKIKYVVNTGNDLPAIEDESKTALFCYDAMVHFELLDIHMYLLEIYRILKPGGKALLHHSNTTFNPCAPNSEKPHRRNFMSAEIFTHLASRANLTVLQQIIIPWGIANLDCLTLLHK